MGAIDTLGKILGKIFGSETGRIIKRYVPAVEVINAFEPEFEELSDADLKKKTAEFRERLADGETLDELLPEAFAAVREASKRTMRAPDGTPMRHFDVQLIGGMVLHGGNIAEMVTGEGKTLVASLAAYLNALKGKVHVITVNDYLAKRDAMWMGPIFNMLDIKCGFIQSHMDNEARKQAYQCEITYGTNSEFGFDYLRDNMKVALADQAQGPLDFAIVDEVDSILIDEARTPLIISGRAEAASDKYEQADRVARMLRGVSLLKVDQLYKEYRETNPGIEKKQYEMEVIEQKYDFTFDEKHSQVMLTERGIQHAQEILGVESFYTAGNMDWPHHLDQALRAHSLFKRDKEYVVKDGEVIIVDEFTGRLMEGRTWSDGLHQAVEAKERIRIKEENQTLATITIQNFFKLYKKISGMTGTAYTEAAEFDKIYKLGVMVIPPNKPLRRSENPDIVYATKEEKWHAVEEEIVGVHATGRPMLVGTTSVENSEMLSERLTRRGIKHEVLNAKHHEREAMIVAKAGLEGNVTIATNMAGRGTDILLGTGIADRGGLHIVGTDRHEARRIDNQLRGRAGRQGDPGSSVFFVALEDDLMRIFASERVQKILKFLGMRDGVALQHPMVSRAIEKAQRKVEQFHFDIRKNLLEYDGVMNEQRKLIYGERQSLLEGKAGRELILDWTYEVIAENVPKFAGDDMPSDERNWMGLINWAKLKFDLTFKQDELEDKKESEIVEYIFSKFEERYEAKEKRVGPENMRRLEFFLLLTKIDEKWKDHLYGMDQLRSAIGLRGYAQVDPKLEYKREGYRMFGEMYNSIKDEVSGLILKVEMVTDQDEEAMADTWEPTNFKHEEAQSWQDLANQKEQAIEASKKTEEKPEPIYAGPKVGRNDPCPCGSGLKYKKCCGLKAAKN
jgi:preprotein translocase subunit SecA